MRPLSSLSVGSNSAKAPRPDGLQFLNKTGNESQSDQSILVPLHISHSQDASHMSLSLNANQTNNVVYHNHSASIPFHVFLHRRNDSHVFISLNSSSPLKIPSSHCTLELNNASFSPITESSSTTTFSAPLSTTVTSSSSK